MFSTLLWQQISVVKANLHNQSINNDFYNINKIINKWILATSVAIYKYWFSFYLHTFELFPEKLNQQQQQRKQKFRTRNNEEFLPISISLANNIYVRSFCIMRKATETYTCYNIYYLSILFIKCVTWHASLQMCLYFSKSSISKCIITINSMYCFFRLLIWVMSIYVIYIRCL